MPVKRKAAGSKIAITTATGKGKGRKAKVAVVDENSSYDQPTYTDIDQPQQDVGVSIGQAYESQGLFDDVVMETNEPIVMQLAINPTRIDELISGEDINSILTYKPIVTEPQPYCPYNRFASDHVQINETVAQSTDSYEFVKPAFLQSQPSNTNSVPTAHSKQQHHDIKCFWCCHNIVDVEYGMPVRYDVIHESFTVFGSFCSLECTSAYNCSINMGSNRVWEINSWIQLLGQKYGFLQPIRPAPPRYILKTFNGTVDIAEFRTMHKGLSQTCVMNIPPFIHITSQMELINTSFLDSLKDKDKDKSKDAKAVEYKDKDKDKDKDKEKEKEKERDKDREPSPSPSVFRTPYRSIERNMNLKFEQV